MIPVHLKYQIESLENRARTLGADYVKIALFDLDNTLIIGDIGEAVFAHLLADEAPLKCTVGRVSIISSLRRLSSLPSCR